MGRANYREIPSLIVGRKDFEGNSMSGFSYGDNYVINSYSTNMAEYRADDGTWWVNGQYYSRTTSRHQGIIMSCLHSMGYELVDRPSEFWYVYGRKS